MSIDERPRIETVSYSSDPDLRTSADVCDQLFVVVSGDRPLAPPTRHLLEGIDEIELGRSHTTVIAARSGRRLSLAIPDRRVSNPHARLTRTPAGWVLEDGESKNGTFIGNDRVAAPAVLLDGALFSIGNTFLLVRTAARVVAPLDGSLETMSPTLGRAYHDLLRVIATGASILVQGETGTGKERVARTVHARTARTGPLVAVNCGAMVPSLAASELFGHLRGAFSGAAADRVGLIASADGGTLLLDEIGDLPREVQPALLRVLQEREVHALGATRPQPVDLRVVSASHCDLILAVADGSFRPDLHARVAGFTLVVPPLRARREDTGLIIAELVRRLAPDPEGVTLSRGALLAIFAYDWPQNIRELASAIEVALALAPDGVIRAEHLSPAVRGELARDLAGGSDPVLAAGTGADGLTPRAPLAERRAAELMRLLEQHAGNVAEVARALGRQRTLVHRWLRRYGIDPSHYRR